MLRPTAVVVAFAAAVMLALVGVHPSGPPVAEAAKLLQVKKRVKVKTYKASARKGRLVAYRLKNVRPRAIRRARLSNKRRWQRLSVRRVRRGARRGLLVVRVRRKLLRAARRKARTKDGTKTKGKGTTPKLVIVHADGTVSLAEPIDSGSTTTQTNTTTSPPPVEPAPAPPAPPAPAPGACTFGTFDVGNWPGACWRPYSPDSPFNQRLPENPRLVPNSTQIVQRITGFGPSQNITAGQAGTTRDSGDPIYWSRPTDPEFTIHCEADWGTCSIEGHKVRIPQQAQPALGSDGHMTVIDQSTGWEYDFWNVEMMPPQGGGTLTIGWGGRTRIDGMGLDSDATAAHFGNVAGKLRVEELEAGRIDHALFLAIRCSNGKVVYPVIHGHAGQRCSQIGMSEENAPPMGTRLMLDMTYEEIQALAVPSWKKTILHAMREYGAFMGDTGSNWAITEESGMSRVAFGHEDPWVKFAKENNVPYYAPHDVYVFNMQNGVDWQNRLRVVDPCVTQRTC